jgi:hypothetical protein
MLTNSVILTNNIYQNLASTGQGGVMLISKKNVLIISCFFHKNSSPSTGGCIYFSSSNCLIKCSTFSNSYATLQSDNGGNAIYITGNEFNLSFSLIDHCAPTSTTCGDSSLLTFNCYFCIVNLNSTSNIGNRGSSSFAGFSCKPNSLVKYIQAISGTDYIVMESATNHYSVYFTNFINCTHHYRGLFWLRAHDQMTIDSCIFINPHTTVSANGNYRLIFINCYSNSDISTYFPRRDPITTIPSLIIHTTDCILYQCFCSKYNKFHFSNFINYFFPLIVIFI